MLGERLSLRLLPPEGTGRNPGTERDRKGVRTRCVGDRMSRVSKHTLNARRLECTWSGVGSAQACASGFRGLGHPLGPPSSNPPCVLPVAKHVYGCCVNQTPAGKVISCKNRIIAVFLIENALGILTSAVGTVVPANIPPWDPERTAAHSPTAAAQSNKKTRGSAFTLSHPVVSPAFPGRRARGWNR